MTVTGSEPAPRDDTPAEPASPSRFPGAGAWAALPPRARALFGGGALIAVVLLVWAVASGPGDSPTPADSAAAGASQAGGLQVAPLNGCRLLSDGEIEEAMGLLDIPWEERILIQFGGGEACTWVHARDGVDVDGLSVRIGPGDVEDFASDAQLARVTGQPVSGVGRLAVWFGAEREGTLSVVAESSLGYLFLRVTVARPDLDTPDILPVARDLAIAALPRFPGMEAAATPEPVTITIEHEPPDTSDVSWVDNLLAKQASRAWTEGEGLVATLKVFVGELDARAVLLHPELRDDSGTGIVSLARTYLEDGPDPTARAEIARLLDLVVLSRERLEAVTGIGPPTVRLAAFRDPPDPRVPPRVDDICEGLGTTPPCLVEFSSPDLTWLGEHYGQRKYRIYVSSDYAEAGWTEVQLGWAASAMRKAATLYEELGSMPPVDFVFTNWGGPHLLTWAVETCGININRPMQGELEAPFKQRIAAEMAYCMFSATVPELAPEGAGSGRWWADGLAWYLSNSVYPAPRCGGDRCDLEWFGLPDALAAQELEADLFHRAAPNELFFQHMWWLVGDDDDIMRLIRSLPPGAGSAGHAEAVADYPGMATIFHEFAKRLTDSSSSHVAGIRDTGGLTVPFDPDATDISISSAPTHVLRDLQPFQAERVAIDVADGAKACIEYSDPGTSMTSWRPGYEGAEGVEGGWSDELPEIIEGELVVVITTTRPGESISLTVTKLIDADESECDPPSPPPPGECPVIVCDPSSFFRSLAELPQWFVDALE